MSTVCNHCGSQVRNAASFCPKCGVALVAKTKAIPTLLGLIVAGALVWLLVRQDVGRSSAAPAPDSASVPQSMDVQIHLSPLSGQPVLHIVSTNTEPFVITRVVFNNRIGVPGCDQSVAMNEVVCEAAKAENSKADFCKGMESTGITQQECQRLKTLWMKLDCRDKTQQQQKEIGGSDPMLGYLQEANLKTGDSLDFYPGSAIGLNGLGSCGSSIVVVDIYTDRETKPRRFTFSTP